MNKDIQKTIWYTLLAIAILWGALALLPAKADELYVDLLKNGVPEVRETKQTGEYTCRDITLSTLILMYQQGFILENISEGELVEFEVVHPPMKDTYIFRFSCGKES